MFRIATFNVENLDDNADEKNPPLAERIPVLRRELERLDADVLCLQEVHGQELPGHTADRPRRELSALRAVLERTRYESYSIASTQTGAGVPYNERNLVVLSKLPIQRVEQYRNDRIEELQYRRVTAVDPPDTEAKPVRWERPILHVQISLNDASTLHVLNLHLKSRLASSIPGQRDRWTWNSAAGWAEGYFLSSIKRVGQALETRLLIDELFDGDPTAKIVVCGDFNAEPGEVPVEAILGRVENTNNPALRGRVLIPFSRAIPSSVRYSHLHHGHGNLLDHMVVSQSLLPHIHAARINNENLHDESLPFAFDTKYPESDHAAFVAEFRDMS